MHVLLWCIYKWHQNTLHVLKDNGCSIRVYQSFVTIFQKIPVMLALCLILSVTYYTQNYAGIIGWTLSLIEAAVVREQPIMLIYYMLCCSGHIMYLLLLKI